MATQRKAKTFSKKAQYSVRKENSLRYEDISELMLTTDPWKKMGFKEKDVEAIIKNSKLKDTFVIYEKLNGGKKNFAGFALLVPGFLGGFYLNLLAVKSQYRGQGLGEILMKHCEDYVFARSNNFYLCVSSFNKGGEKFYRRLGFKKVGTLKELVIKNNDEYFYRKTIGPWR